MAYIFLKKFGGHKSFCGATGYPCLGLLVTSALRFKASGVFTKYKISNTERPLAVYLPGRELPLAVYLPGRERPLAVYLPGRERPLVV